MISTAGLTYAEYARSGFFQLLAVASITLGALLGLRGVADLSDPRVRRRFTLLAEIAAGQTLVIVAVALRRLGLYQDAFGLTMLRLCSAVFALWVGVVVVLAACALAGLGSGRSWFVGAAVLAGLIALLALNVVNPEAVVARHNVDRAVRTENVDPGYLAELSDDAVPALVDGLARLPAPARQEVLRAVCGNGALSAAGWWAPTGPTSGRWTPGDGSVERWPAHDVAVVLLETGRWPRDAGTAGGGWLSYRASWWSAGEGQGR